MNNKIIRLLISWRLSLFLFQFIGINVLSLQNNFLGGGMKHYLTNPYFWSWVNFDGEHFLTIAQKGYEPLTHFFFPVYPHLVKIFSLQFDPNSFNLAIVGLSLSHVFTVLAIIGIYKLVLLDHSSKTAFNTILLILLFPSSFFLVSFYSESLFLALVVWSFYFARKHNWPLAIALASLATATRVIGIVMLPALLTEMFLQHRSSSSKFNNLNYLWLIIIPVGLLMYLKFLWNTTGDPLIFLNTISIYGAQRSSSLILLPQVFYRYIFKILPSLNSYWPATYTILLEFLIATLISAISVISIFKMRLSYWVYMTGVFLIPALAGSFSSMPRYAIVMFPAFIFAGKWFSKQTTMTKLVISTIMIINLGLATTMFIRGYWIS